MVQAMFFSLVVEVPDAAAVACRYVNQEEPQLKGRSVTVKADEQTVQEMHRSAEATFTPALAKLMQAWPKKCHPFTAALLLGRLIHTLTYASA